RRQRLLAARRVPVRRLAARAAAAGAGARRGRLRDRDRPPRAERRGAGAPEPIAGGRRRGDARAGDRRVARRAARPQRPGRGQHAARARAGTPARERRARALGPGGRALGGSQGSPRSGARAVADGGRPGRDRRGDRAAAATLIRSPAVSQLDKELRERIDDPVSPEAEREARLSPEDAVSQMRIKVPAQRSRKLRTIIDRVNADDGLKAYWHVSNVNAVKRLGINDHSWVHIQIVANIGLRLLRILPKRGVEPAMVADYDMKQEDAEVVVLLGALLHCIGMAVHRDRHEDWSLFLAEPKARELLAGIYEEPELTVVVSEVLETITSHRE